MHMEGKVLVNDISNDDIACAGSMVVCLLDDISIYMHVQF